MRTDALVESDLRALADATARELPSASQTARRLEAALARPAPRRRARMLVAAVALGAGTLVVPFPWTRAEGWDATLRTANGASATVHFAVTDEGEARRRAVALGHQLGAEVTVAPRHRIAWRSVYAMARERLFRVDVELRGKSDADVEAEIAAQLAAQGWSPANVTVRRADGMTVVELGADRDGRHLQIAEKTDGAGAERVVVEPEPLDETREPGMTDEQLREKLLAQLRARGLDAEVVVQGDHIEIRAEKQGHD